MLEAMDAVTRKELADQIYELNNFAFAAKSRDRYDMVAASARPCYPAQNEQQRFEKMDKLLRTIYTDSTLGRVYMEIATALMFENNGEVALKPLIAKVNAYRKGKRP